MKNKSRPIWDRRPSNRVELQSGARTLDFYTADGEFLCTIRFRAIDPGIGARFTRLAEEIQRSIDPVIELGKSGRLMDPSSADVVQRADEEIELAVNKALRADFSPLFSLCSPTALVSGRFFIIDVLEQVRDCIIKPTFLPTASARARFGERG